MEWLGRVTLQDWTEIYGRELRDSPPAEDFLAGYFHYEPPGDDVAPAEEVTLPTLADL